MKIIKPIIFFILALASLALSTLPALAFDDDYNEKLNGTTLHFRVRGADKKNPTLLILHGGPGFSAFMFYPWGASLEKKLNVVYLDQRGCGGSERLKFKSLFAPKPEEVADYTFANLIKDIEAVRTFLKLESWYVLGHSWGGMLGLEYVATHPKQTKGYIHMDGLLSTPMATAGICDTAETKFQPFLESEDATKKKQAESILKTVERIRGLPDENPIRFTSALQLASGPAGLYFAKDQPAGFLAFQTSIVAALKPYDVPQKSLQPASEPSLALIQTERYLTRDCRPLLSKIQVRTLVINGKQDGVITPKIAELVHQGIASSQLVLLDQCGHFPFGERPEETTDVILKFVGF